MKRLYILMSAFVMLGMTSCTIQQKTIPSAAINAQVNLTMSDLEYVGEVSGTSTQSYFLIFPYGGRKYHVAATTPQSLFGPSNLPLNRGVQNAIYDALQQKPDADFVLPMSVETTRKQMFLGSKRTVKVRAKAFKIRAN